MLPQHSNTVAAFAKRSLRSSKDELLDSMLQPHIRFSNIPLAFARNVERRYNERDAAKELAETVATKIKTTQDALFFSHKLSSFR